MFRCVPGTFKMMKWIKWIFVGFVVIVLLGVLNPFMGEGSPWLARRFVKRLSPINSIEDARRIRGVMSREFNDGSWLCGIACGSHGNPWGGTLVTKDSTGKTRVFFGHVCAPPGALAPALLYSSNSLVEAYSNLIQAELTQRTMFTEQNIQ